MTDISPINTGRAPGVERIQHQQASRPDATNGATINDTRARAPRQQDQVELSNVARYLSELKAGPAERAELISRIREEIDAGQYDTPEKFDAVIDGIKEDLEFTL